MGNEHATVNLQANSSSNAASSKQQPVIDPSLLHSYGVLLAHFEEEG